jgi:hypothetical protein
VFQIYSNIVMPYFCHYCEISSHQLDSHLGHHICMNIYLILLSELYRGLILKGIGLVGKDYIFDKIENDILVAQ